MCISFGCAMQNSQCECQNAYFRISCLIHNNFLLIHCTNSCFLFAGARSCADARETIRASISLTKPYTSTSRLFQLSYFINVKPILWLWNKEGRLKFASASSETWRRFVVDRDDSVSYCQSRCINYKSKIMFTFCYIFNWYCQHMIQILIVLNVC